MGERRVAIVYGTVAGVGGLGLQVATAIASFASGGDRVIAIGPGFGKGWPLDVAPEQVQRLDDASALFGATAPLGGMGWTPLRWYQGFKQWVNDMRCGRAAARRLDEARPDLVYAFTQVAEETLGWCRARGVPSILDNPNGHIRNYARVCDDEWRRWCGGTHRGHATQAMVRRVEREYALADRVRVSSEWAKGSMVRGGVAADKITVVDQPLDLTRFSPAHRAPGADAGAEPGLAPLRLCYVGSIDARKGVLYLLRAMRAASSATKLVIVGNTGTRPMRRAVAREVGDMDVAIGPGDPVPAYAASELFVLPSLEDGFGFVVAEAMICGLPVIVTDQCGAAEWVASAGAGWVVPAADAGAIARAIDEAYARRSELAAMGARGREYAMARGANERCFRALRAFAWRGEAR